MVFTVSVPAVAGVPPIFQTPGFINAISLLASDAVGIQIGTPAWGIYLDGSPAVTAETVVGLDYRNESALSDYPIERGGFETFDKVAVPYNARVRFAAGGSVAVREALLTSIAAIAGDLQLYDVVTPEAVYSNANVTHYDYRRANQNGRSLMVVDVWLEEVRQNASLAMDSTAAASGSDPVNTGTVQAVSQNQVSPGLSSQGFTTSGFSGATGTSVPSGISSQGFASQPLT